MDTLAGCLPVPYPHELPHGYRHLQNELQKLSVVAWSGHLAYAATESLAFLSLSRNEASA